MPKFSAFACCAVLVVYLVGCETRKPPPQQKASSSTPDSVPRPEQSETSAAAPGPSGAEKKAEAEPVEPAPPAPEVVTVTALVEAFMQNDREFTQKYNEQTLDVSGTILSFKESLDGKYDVVQLDTGMPDSGIQLNFQMTEFTPWKKSSPGQKVTLRGRLVRDFKILDFQEATFVKLDTAFPPPPELKAEDIAAEVGKDRQGFETKYKGKWIWLSGNIQVVKAGIIKGSEAVSIRVDVMASPLGRNLQHFRNHQPGDAVRLLGQVTGASDEVVDLRHCCEFR